MRKQQVNTNQYVSFMIMAVSKYWKWMLLFALFLCFLFLRMYNFTQLNPFAWDQVDNAWAAKHIIIDHNFPLAGMVLKQNSNINIGPLYYYFISIFYFFTRLDPIASGIIAGVTSAISFITLYVFTKKLFSFPTAVIASVINTFSVHMVLFDRVQWPVAFIPAISLVILYLLYKSIMVSPRYLIALGIMIGLSFHIHFTSIFYPLFVLLSIPFLPRKKGTIIYGFLSIVIVVIFLIPSIVTFFQANYFNHALQYGNSYYHGFHLKRMLQIAGDAFIQFIPYTTDSLVGLIPDQLKTILGYARFILLPLFIFLSLRSKLDKRAIVISYLFILWFMIPWIIFTTYNGEISEYYFSVNKFIALIIMSWLLSQLFLLKNYLWKGFVVALLTGYVYINSVLFFQLQNPFGLDYHRKQTLKEISKAQPIQFVGGMPESYLYYEYKMMKWPY